MKKLLAAVVLLVVGFAGGFFSYRPYRDWTRGRERRLAYENLRNTKAPAVVTTHLDGTPWLMRQQSGKITIVDFWATWCQPCVARIPEMKRLHEAYGKSPDVQVIGVSLDEDRARLVAFIQEQGLEYPILFEDGKAWNNSFAQAFAIDAIPSIWVLDHEQRAVGVNLRDDAEVARVVEQLRSGHT